MGCCDGDSRWIGWRSSAAEFSRQRMSGGGTRISSFKLAELLIKEVFVTVDGRWGRDLGWNSASEGRDDKGEGSPASYGELDVRRRVKAESLMLSLMLDGGLVGRRCAWRVGGMCLLLLNPSQQRSIIDFSGGDQRCSRRICVFCSSGGFSTTLLGGLVLTKHDQHGCSGDRETQTTAGGLEAGSFGDTGASVMRLALWRGAGVLGGSCRGMAHRLRLVDFEVGAGIFAEMIVGAGDLERC